MTKKLARFRAAAFAAAVLASPVLAAHGGKAGSTIVAGRN
jgi:hypothetical protein